jgi:hypothetical protein
VLKCSRANGKISEGTSKREGERQRYGGRVRERVLTKELACRVKTGYQALSFAKTRVKKTRE